MNALEGGKATSGRTSVLKSDVQLPGMNANLDQDSPVHGTEQSSDGRVQRTSECGAASAAKQFDDD
jgi:hypothetical protein